MLTELFLDGIISITERLGDRFLQVIDLVLNPRKITFDASYLVLYTGYFTFKPSYIFFSGDARHLLRYRRCYKLLKIGDNLFIHMLPIINHFRRKHYRQIDDGKSSFRQAGSSSGKAARQHGDPTSR